MQWEYLQISNSPIVNALSEGLNIPSSLANILVQRGIQEFDEAKHFFRPDLSDLHDPFLMLNMEKAAQRVLDAGLNKEKILVYGDYDVDGTSAVSLYYLILKEWGFSFDFYIPDRYSEGYGVSFKGIEYAESIGATLIITLDCGIKAHDPVKYAATKGIEVIVCDHHEPGENLPSAYAILDPKQFDCPYPFKELSGCGVGYKLLEGVFTLWKNQGVPEHLQSFSFTDYYDLIALSIACDLVPILGENRIIAHAGLLKIRENPLPGIGSIMSLATGNAKTWSISDLVFFIGPRINAAGRIRHARHAVEVLTGQAGVSALADDLNELNKVRKEHDEEISAHALELLYANPGYESRFSTVLYHPEWHKGVIGIVASRVVERHFRPTILLTKSAEGVWVGSARSIPGFDLHAALSECEHILLQFGGHKFAAGLSVSDEMLPVFSEAFEKVCRASLEGTDLVPKLSIDYYLTLDELDNRFVRIQNQMEPFGPGNLQPVLASFVQVKEYRILQDKHIQMEVRSGKRSFNAIAFNALDKLELVKSGPIGIAYHAGFNVWRDKTEIRMVIKDICSEHQMAEDLDKFGIE